MQGGHPAAAGFTQEADLRWQDHAACTRHGPDTWYPEHGEVQTTTQKAKRICKYECPVRLACLAYALRTREGHGIWGGMTEKERRNAFRGSVDVSVLAAVS